MNDIKAMLDNRDTDAAVVARATQDDPWVMYFVVNRDLQMSVGKTAAQVAHAAHLLMLNYFSLKENICHIRDPLEIKMIENFETWMNNSFRKVVLTAGEKKFNKFLEDNPNNTVVVRDAGLTEIAPNSLTVIGVLPTLKSMAPRSIKKMQVLK